LTTQLRIVHAESRQTYGRPRLQRALRAEGIRIGERRVRRLMHAADVHPRRHRHFRVTTDSRHAAHLVGNRLARQFAVAEPNRVWAADITACWTTEGWIYLAVVLDLASRRVVGWAVRATLETELVLAALHLAIGARPVAPGLIHHSDRGVQYASGIYQHALAQYGLVPSMSRVGDCWDNAPVESFFSHFKAEALPDRPWPTRTMATRAIADHIAFYNRRRLHSALDYRSPVAYEMELAASL
jgi:transposase InsO family protein